MAIRLAPPGAPPFPSPPSRFPPFPSRSPPPTTPSSSLKGTSSKPSTVNKTHTRSLVLPPFFVHVQVCEMYCRRDFTIHVYITFQEILSWSLTGFHLL
ncbi:unnamed protein product [Chondrus crispus]|uniref:Uncharacterized protein n=1 Tax=Chondrus crispus TaxID=2769 RepID=R7QNX5_CHOCR|nr:unnamed protein product [Chondrus crispus]CDF39080.1 unnamed protein product [Chondrus crispus]|eukprot:XP_005718991.1 unnamed protein product [Chondrus crispus]